VILASTASGSYWEVEGEMGIDNHRMVWVGRDLKGHLVPLPLSWAGTPSTFPQSPVQPSLEHLQGEAATASLGSLCQGHTTLTVIIRRRG